MDNGTAKRIAATIYKRHGAQLDQLEATKVIRRYLIDMGTRATNERICEIQELYYDLRNHLNDAIYAWV